MKFGVLTTVNAWVFLMRENNGKLYMTRPVDCRVTEPTILQGLYYISALSAQQGYLPETDHAGKPVIIALANSKYPHAAPTITAQAPPKPVPPPTFIFPLPGTYGYQLIPYEFGQGILLEPWKSKNRLGHKTFLAVLMPHDISVVVKLWDGYKSSAADRDNEVEIYMHLRGLWGKEIPQLICSADIDFCLGIILEDIQVPRLRRTHLRF
jgi:hypothetical protein